MTQAVSFSGNHFLHMFFFFVLYIETIRTIRYSHARVVCLPIYTVIQWLIREEGGYNWIMTIQINNEIVLSFDYVISSFVNFNECGG